MKRLLSVLLTCTAIAACSQPAPPADKPETSSVPAAKMATAAAAGAPMERAAATSEPSATTSVAHLPQLDIACPHGIALHVGEDGHADINGQPAGLKAFSATYYEATDAASGVTVSILLTPDGPATVSYTGRHGINGVCVAS